MLICVMFAKIACVDLRGVTMATVLLAQKEPYLDQKKLYFCAWYEDTASIDLCRIPTMLTASLPSMRAVTGTITTPLPSSLNQAPV